MKCQQSVLVFFVLKNQHQKLKADGGTDSCGSITESTFIKEQHPASMDKEQQPVLQTSHPCLSWSLKRDQNGVHNKISEHKKCLSDLKCKDIVKENGRRYWKGHIKQNGGVEKSKRKKFKVTERCLHTANRICKNDLSFRIEPALVELQVLNLGNMLNTNKACQTC